MEIKIVGTHCVRCRTLENLVRRAVKELSLDAKISYVDDPREMIKYTLSTPALVIDERVVIKGKVPTYPQVVSLITTSIDDVRG